MHSRFTVRAFTPADAEPTTDLLHRAYGEHLAAGLNFTAATQSAQTTASRAHGGGCWVVTDATRIVATVAVSIPPSHGLQELSVTAREPGTAWLNQFAVDPTLRGEGIASALFAHAVDWARTQRMTRLGIDTAAPASGLRAMYRHWGFEHRETIRWDGKTYDSAVMIRHL